MIITIEEPIFSSYSPPIYNELFLRKYPYNSRIHD